MLLEGLKLMIVGMATVMLFLMLLIACIEWVRFLTRNFTLNQEQSLLQSRKSDSNKFNNVTNLELPVEVFAAAIASYESDNSTSYPIYKHYIKTKIHRKKSWQRKK